LRIKYFPKVKAPKYIHQGKCDICLKLKEQKSAATDPSEKAKFHQQFVEHNNNQMKERFNYKSRAVNAQLQPTEYLSIILDGMNAPHFPIKLPISKNTCRLERLKLHVHGLIDHGNNVRKLYGSLDHWKHGSDFVVSVLVHYLKQLKLTKQDVVWPHTFFLQVNNCWKENKNRTMFSFLSLLIV
jgi:hypothetical protein